MPELAFLSLFLRLKVFGNLAILGLTQSLLLFQLDYESYFSGNTEIAHNYEGNSF